MVTYPIDFITPPLKPQATTTATTIPTSAARTDNDHAATAASSWHQQRTQLVEKGCHWSGMPTLSYPSNVMMEEASGIEVLF